MFNISDSHHLFLLGMNERVFLLTSCSCWMYVWRFLSKEWRVLSTCMWALPYWCGNTPDSTWVLINPLNYSTLKLPIYADRSVPSPERLNWKWNDLLVLNIKDLRSVLCELHRSTAFLKIKCEFPLRLIKLSIHPSEIFPYNINMLWQL